MIILTKDQAESLAFNTKDEASPLNAVLLKDGTFALPDDVLQTHPDRRWYLEGLPRRPVADDEFA